MRLFRFCSRQALAAPLPEVFPFFAEASNLELLTPPWLHFEVLTPRPIEMAAGRLIDYRLRLHGLPLRWQSEITVWDPPFRFVDVQRRGPYRRWVHEHRFHEDARITIVEDQVSYAVPGGWLVNRLFVAPALQRIFAYRRSMLVRCFGDGDPLDDLRTTTSSTDA